jgi:hypothetical protein
MKRLFSVVAVAFVICIAMVSPPVRNAAAADGGTSDAGAAPGPSDCATCIQCMAGCTTAYAECTRKCLGQPDFKSQQACQAQCPTVITCAQACPCSGCANVPGLPH